jgi:hypothetical protein
MKNIKIVINSCYGGFGLSPDGAVAFYKRKGIKAYCFKDDHSTDYDNRKYLPLDKEDKKEGFLFFTIFSVPNPNEVDKKELWDKYHLSNYDIKRDDQDLVAVVESLKKKANGACANLTVVEIPDDVSWSIQEYDGNEWVAEEHRTWS